jgi:hypothetical protein
MAETNITAINTTATIEELQAQIAGLANLGQRFGEKGDGDVLFVERCDEMVKTVDSTSTNFFPISNNYKIVYIATYKNKTWEISITPTDNTKSFSTDNFLNEYNFFLKVGSLIFSMLNIDATKYTTYSFIIDFSYSIFSIMVDSKESSLWKSTALPFYIPSFCITTDGTEEILDRYCTFNIFFSSSEGDTKDGSYKLSEDYIGFSKETGVMYFGGKDTGVVISGKDGTSQQLFITSLTGSYINSTWGTITKNVVSYNTEIAPTLEAQPVQYNSNNKWFILPVANNNSKQKIYRGAITFAYSSVKFSTSGTAVKYFSIYYYNGTAWVPFLNDEGNVITFNDLIDTNAIKTEISSGLQTDFNNDVFTFSSIPFKKSAVKNFTSISKYAYPYGRFFLEQDKDTNSVYRILKLNYYKKDNTSESDVYLTDTVKFSDKARTDAQYGNLTLLQTEFYKHDDTNNVMSPYGIIPSIDINNIGIYNASMMSDFKIIRLNTASDYGTTTSTNYANSYVTFSFNPGVVDNTNFTTTDPNVFNMLITPKVVSKSSSIPSGNKLNTNFDVINIGSVNLTNTVLTQYTISTLIENNQKTISIIINGTTYKYIYKKAFYNWTQLSPSTTSSNIIFSAGTYNGIVYPFTQNAKYFVDSTTNNVYKFYDGLSMFSNNSYLIDIVEKYKGDTLISTVPISPIIDKTWCGLEIVNNNLTLQA